MAFLILFMVASLLGAFFYFRWRAAHPLPEPDSIRTALDDDSTEDGSRDPEGPGAEGRSWERSGDWWREEEADGDDDDRGLA